MFTPCENAVEQAYLLIRILLNMLALERLAEVELELYQARL